MSGWLISILALSACGDEPPAPDADTEASYAVDPSWTEPACTPAALGPPSGANTCNGPWTYSYADSCAGAPAPTCKTWKSCAGTWGTPRHVDELYGGYVWQCTTTCTGGGGGGGNFRAPPRCTTTCTGPGVPQTYCAQLGRNREAHWEAHYTAQGAPAHQILPIVGVGTAVDIRTSPSDNVTTTFFSCKIDLDHVPIFNTGRREECGCETYNPQVCVPTQGTVRVVTPPGQAKPNPMVPAPTQHAVRTVSVQPTCLTCDAITDVNAKFTCLHGGLAPALARNDADLHDSLVARLKLLFQLQGEQLTAAQRTIIGGLYADEPAAAPACSTPVAWSTACTAADDDTGIEPAAQLCNDLRANPLVPTSVRVAELPGCHAALADTSTLSSATCRLPMRDGLDADIQQLILLTHPTYTTIASALPAVLARLYAWGDAAAIAAAGDSGWYLDRSSALLRGLWAAIHRDAAPLRSSPIPPGDPQALAMFLADVHDKGLPNDMAVLSGLFAAGQAPSSPLLLTLTGDSLTALGDRLERLQVIHDVGCRFARCATPLRTSATSELVRALAAIPSKAALTAALRDATHLSTGGHVAIYDALARIRDQHAYLTAAWASLDRPEPFADLAALEAPPVQVAALAAIVRSASRAWASYESAGQFTPWLTPRVTSAVLQQQALVLELDRLIGVTAGARTTYENARLATLNDLIAQNQGTVVPQSAFERVRALKDQKLVQLRRRLGLEVREANERARLARYQADFEALVASGVLDVNADYSVATVAPMQPSAADAHYPVAAGSPDLTRDAFNVIPLQSGQALRLRVSGGWSPTCAIRNASLATPDGPVPLTVGDAVTGPRGFWVNRESSGYKSKSVTVANAESRGVSAEVCMGLTGSTGVPWLSASGKLCASYNRTHTKTRTEGGGSQHTASATFASGIRLPNTPFPEAPAGSLVAVMTPHDAPGTFLDVAVVEDTDLLIAPLLETGPGAFEPGAIDVHLVVNDRTGCTVDVGAKLSIEAWTTTPVGQLAIAIGTATTETLAELERQAPEILAQGQLSGSELTAVRAAAWVMVQNRLPLGTTLAGLPYDLRQLFEAVLEAHLASLDRRAQIYAASLELDRLDLELDAVATEAAIAADHNRLLYLMPRWRVRALQGTELVKAIAPLAEALTAYVAPVFELRDPASFTNFRAAVDADLQDLIDLDVTVPIEANVTELEGFATSARNAISGAHFEVPVTERHQIAVAIPKDYATWEGPFHKVSQTAADELWRATDLHGIAAITLTPSDLYGASGDGAELVCGDLGPVVRRAALFVETQATGNLRAFNLNAATQAAKNGAAVVYPVGGKDLRFELTDLLGAPMRLPVMSGNNTEVFDGTHFGGLPDVLAAGAGISPFTSFAIDMAFTSNASAADTMADALAIILVFEVERRAANQQVVVPGVCSL